VNGNINTSSAGVSISNITNAVVTPTTLTTSSSSVTLDASASTSGSGTLHYQFNYAADCSRRCCNRRTARRRRWIS